MSIDKDRLRGLVRAGKLSAREAAQMGQALDRMERSRREPGERPQPKRGRSDMARLKLSFLSGEIDEAQYFAGIRRTSILAGVLFGLLMVPTFAFIGWEILFDQPDPEIPSFLMWGVLLIVELVVGVPHAIAAGLFFGWAMHRFVFLPPARRLVAIQSEVDLSVEPLERTRPGQCPTCGAEHKKTWTPWSPTMLHWVLNPGLAFNDLVLGQRIAREFHQCRECGTSFIDCRTCQTSVDALDWSILSQFGRWRGMRCARCGGSIPCLRNALALIIEAPVRLAVWLYDQLPGRTEAHT